jgi:hypothetical protein
MDLLMGNANVNALKKIEGGAHSRVFEEELFPKIHKQSA